MGEAETTSPAKPPCVILGPIQTEAVAFCSLLTKRSPGEGEEGEGRRPRARAVPVPLLPYRLLPGVPRARAGRGKG